MKAVCKAAVSSSLASQTFAPSVTLGLLVIALACQITVAAMDKTLPGTPFEQFLRHSIDSDDSFMEESQVVADFSEEVLKDISLLPTSDSAMCQLAEKGEQNQRRLEGG